jgi:hypothetical protein
MSCHLLQFRPVQCYFSYAIGPERRYLSKSNEDISLRSPEVQPILAIDPIHVSGPYSDSLECIVDG